MIGRTNVAGGDNLKNAYAIISVEYPAGSTLTCTNAATGKTYRADNTYGAWAFGVNSSGTWILNCSNEEIGESTSATVDITEQYQTVHVELSYKFFLYKNGDLCGYDWKICRHNNGYATPEGANMYYSSNGGGGAQVANGFFVNQKIDLSDYSEFSAHILEAEAVNLARLFITDAVQSSNQMYYYIANNQSKIIAQKLIGDALPSDGIVTLDVSALYGEYFLNIGTRASGTRTNATLRVDQVWLKK